ncbi:Uncharacterized protein ECG_09177 [Echinococcus granulosus]|nr:Uncharacterized protein ECG_09177 [Echinococcus granulosus]
MLTLSATSTASRRVARPSALHLPNSLTHAMAETAQRDVVDQSLSTSTAARHDSPSSSNEHTRSGRQGMRRTTRKHPPRLCNTLLMPEQTSPRFSMDEDFPALPTAQKPTTPLTINDSVDGGGGLRAAAMLPIRLLPPPPPPPPPPPSPHPATFPSPIHPHHQLLLHQPRPRMTANQIIKSLCTQRHHVLHRGEFYKACPILRQSLHQRHSNDMVQNQFGMLGLLKLTEIESPLAAFAPGFDLSKTDFENWPPPGEMHNIMASPLSNQFMLPPHDTDWHVPAAYRIRHRIADRLPADPPLAKLTDAILFWIFYNCCREEVQLVAAKELCPHLSNSSPPPHASLPSHFLIFLPTP